MRDDFDSVVADRFRVLDRVPVPDTWSRVVDQSPSPAARPRVPSTAEAVTMIDLDASVRTGSRRTRPTRLVAAGLLAAAAVIAIALVVTRNDDTAPADQPAPNITVPSTTPPRAVLDPVAEIRSGLVDQSTVELFRVKADREAYWRVATLPAFDGRAFTLPNSVLTPLDDGTAMVGRTIRQEIEILGLEGQLLPAAADPRQVTPDAEIRISDAGTLVKTSALSPGDTYTIVSVAPEVSPETLRAASSASPPDDVFLALPDDFSEVVSQVAADVTAGAITDYDRLVALQDWFRTSFDYSTEVQRGHGSNAIESFLEDREGYCEQFAATFAVMARTLGIPSRVAAGYTPGELGSDGWYSVFGRNSHAWPEVWFDDIGWVPFEPTPGRGAPGAEAYTGVPPPQQASP